jgi:NAD(P)-dependent dehydrogenase (short-subunit alcohol dehydrogenase family)
LKDKKMAMPGVEGLRVLVTAGCAGIGRATSEAFAQAGARVHVCDIDPAAREVFQAARPEITISDSDVADPQAVDRLFEEAMAHLGGLDVLVNNAGIAGPTAPIEEIEVADWRRTLAVDLESFYLCTRRAVPILKRQKAGSIVNISSTAGLFGFPLRTPYAAAKWGVIGLTKSLAMELGPHGIRVNAVCPGSVDGPRMDQVIAADAVARGLDETVVRRGYERQASLRSFIAPEDIANMVVFLCSSAGAMISGEALAVDGHTESLGKAEA